MSKINVLSEQLASQIAAGEVVERPASVVKELVENAIDAGAETINIDIRQGGRESIQVADNGTGMSPDDVPVAFRRHATSKLDSVDQLSHIGTLGFRGEALAAISAVSQVTIVTRPTGKTAGVRLYLEGGVVQDTDTVGAPQGTVISVDKLFYNVPARLKFLKTIATEKRLIDEFVTKYALAYPHIRFRLTHDGRINFQSSGSGNLRDVLVSLYGADTARDLLPVGDERPDVEPETPTDERPIVVRGYAGPPSLHRANRNHITLFVNGRWVKDKNLTYAITQAYHTLLPKGRHPVAVVFVQMPLEMVDVNVHPTKTEVRFRQAGRVFAAVQKSIRTAVIEAAPVRSVRAGHFESITQPGDEWAGRSNAGFRPGGGNAGGMDSDGPPTWGDFAPSQGQPQGRLNLDRRSDSEAAWTPPDPAAPPQDLAGEKLPIMRVVGQVGASYIITEGPEGMYLIDQHAAHERIQYERFMAAHQAQQIAVQTLMAGTAVNLPPDQAELLGEHVDVLSTLGFQVEAFGPDAFMVRAVPAVVADQDVLRVINDIVADLERGDTPIQQKVEDKIIRRVCKTASIKAGQTLSRPEMEQLVTQLEQCANPHTCPHGRPTLIYLSVAQLAKEFGRT